MSFKEKLRKILKIDPRVMRKMRKLLAPVRRVGLKKEFTLFANNCWGGRLYDKFSLQYLSPTIGLSMSPNDFLTFLENMDHYLECELTPIPERQKKVNDEWGFYDCRLGDIVVAFRHYRDVEDAISKWSRRKTRISKDNVIVKMSYYPDSELDLSILQRFSRLPYKKLLFISDGFDLDSVGLDLGRIVEVPKEHRESEFVYTDSKLRLKEIKRIINQ